MSVRLGEKTIYERVFADSVEHNGIINFETTNTESVGDFYFTIKSSSNVNWEKISWKPVISYTLENGEYTTESSMNANVNFDGIYGQVYAMGNAYVVDSAGIGTFVPKLKINPTATPEEIASVSGDFTITIKKSLGLIYKGDLKIEKGVITQGADSIKIPVEEEKVWVELFSDNTNMEHMSAMTNLITDFISPSDSTYSIPASIYYRWDDSKFGLLHRSWGQFSYNGMEGRAKKPIEEGELKLPETEGDSNADPIEAIFIPMYPDVNTLSYWRGNNADVYINNEVMSAARLGTQDVILENPLSNLSEGKAIAVSQHNKSKSTSVMAGGGASGINGTISTANGESETMLTFLDLNGDGYPDIVSKNQVQITNTTGGFDGELIKYANYHRSESKAKSIGVGGNPVHANSISSAAAKVQASRKALTTATNEMIASSLGENAEAARSAHDEAVQQAANDKAALEKAETEAYIVPGGGISDNGDEAIETFLDVNGDGLADKVLANKQVQLNLGFGFSSPVDWGLNHIQKGKNTDANISLGFNNDASSWSGGIGINTTWSKSSYAMADVNGDGLVDKVRIDDKQAYVCLSTGNGFGDELVWHGMTKLNRNASTGESLNAAFTIGFFLPVAPVVRVVFNPSVNTGHSINRTMEDFRDVDGDGFPDVVSSDREKTLTVKRSTIARTNKLKEVQNPLGGSFTLDYKRSAATYDHPGGKWVMASLEINDGVADDGANSLTHFDYADGKRDRYEREFLGFGKVITKQLDSENGNALYRMVEQTYDVANYYTAGNSLSSTLKDAEGKVYTHSTQEYYTYKVSVSGDNYTFVEASEINKLSSPMIFSPLKFSQNENHEGGSEKAILQQAHYTYRDGATGELSKYKFSDSGSLKADGSGSFNYQTSISYTDPSTAKRILALPNKVQVKGGDGKLYRETTANYDNLGRITEVAQKLDNGKAVSNFEWDDKGNITKRTMPENSKGQRMWYSYKYERDYYMYPTRIEDAWGYRSELEDYDYRYGVALRTRDMNGYYQEQEIDHMGRLKQITAPNELAEGAPYTIRFSYHNAKMNNGKLENPAYALTEHYDPEHPDNPMRTSTFVDGMGRAIQVKKDGVLANEGNKTEVSIVSGRVKFDAFGRAVEARYPTTASLDEIEKFSTAIDDIEPTITTFDVMDRATQITMPDGTKTTNAYSVEGNLQKVLSTDAKEGKQASYTNGSGLNIKTEQLSGPDDIITTSFKYDAINQLLQAIDTEGNAIVSVYDMGGRRTSVTHPDAGTSSFTYDNLGNVLTRQTANLADSSAVITYQYDYHRLTAINYPLNPENNVKYHYGTKHANHNRVGRLALQEDATGAQEFFYGRLGELTKVRRTHIIPNHAVATFETSWKYDSWNRVQEMIYPDKEKLSYHYDAGGQLEGLTGNKAYSYNYVQDIGYDKFGQRTYIKYCNGTETTYNYDPQMRRLQGLQAKNQSRTFMNNVYSFDDVGNILSVNNKAEAGDVMGGLMSHTYTYDGLYRLATAEGEFTGSDNKVASYSLEMGYDNMHNITSKKQHIAQTDVAFEGELLAGYELEYNYRTDKPHQLEYIKDNNYRTADSTAIASSTKAISDAYSYDSNGNLVFVNSNDSVQTNIKERKLSWDEENRLRSICDNGYVSSYFYDAGGERTVKLHGGAEGIHVNSAFSGGYTNNADYTLYVNAYMVLEKGGQYTKHIYIGDQRIVSKLGDVGSFGIDPRREEYAGEDVAGVEVPDYASKYDALQDVIKDNYATFEVDYYGADNNNYVAGEGFCCGDNSMKTKSIADDSPNYEKLQYYYHPDHLGSASYITNLDGEVVQHIEYVPFGEVFLEERNNTWNTPFLFNGKELDEETGLYYYGARYYNPRISLWYGVDPLAEKYPAHSPYCYTMNNPVMLVDPDGKQVRPGIRYGNINNYNKRPPSAGTIRYTHYNPASRPNRVNTSYFEPSVSNGGSTYTNPQMTRGNKRAQDMNAMVQGAHLLLDEINSITKIEQRTTRGSFTDYRFEFSTKDAEINFKQEQYEFESQYKQKISELDVPINPGSGATNAESKEYRDNLMIYGMKKILIQMDMGDSPKEKLIKAFEANKNEAFEIKSQRTQQKPIIYETPK